MPDAATDPRSIPFRRLYPLYGHGSRTDADAAVAAGRVARDGVVLTDPAAIVRPSIERLAVDGRPFASLPRLYLKMHKPPGVITTLRDPQGRRTVRDLLPPEWRLAKPVGRLDRDSSGLLLLTTDGRLHFAIAGPESQVRKLYRVTVNGACDDADLAPLREGIVLEGERTPLLPIEARVVERRSRTTVLSLALVEGRFRQIRKSLKRLGLRVVELTRIAVGPLALGDLAEGRVAALDRDELRALRDAAGIAETRCIPQLPA